MLKMFLKMAQKELFDRIVVFVSGFKNQQNPYFFQTESEKISQFQGVLIASLSLQDIVGDGASFN